MENQYFSQNDEQKYITEYFKNYNNGRGGKFIEIGAFNAFKFSNTRALFEQGFIGVMVEPNPICMQGLKDVYGKEPRIQLLEVAISDNDGYMKFYQPMGDAIGTTDIAHKEKWEKGANVQYSEIQVQAMSMQNLLMTHGMETDFVNIDVEGTNYQLFQLLPNDFLHRLKMICIEHDGWHQSMVLKLSGFGFRTILSNGENLIMVK